jgi:uncharacterized protein (TIGR00288 family)
MTPRTPRLTPAKRVTVAPMHRGPQAVSHPLVPVPVGAAFHHAPNAALLIDFDNVTMGIRSDLGHELRNLLSSDIIKGKVAVQRAYADWRRYPQYIVPLSESSIDLIFAPAYGSSKKNATDIRLAIDALELVFTRPEIGTFILLSGDSDFSSLVIKLKEYGKYVIGVGIRESSSDLLIQNCDEYYSYNALAGLVKSNEDEPQKFDPWELVTEAITRMKRNGDVMRSDRLKQVMQELDPSFDEKSLGYSKFSRFCTDAAQRGLLSAHKLENGQLEVDVPGAAAASQAAEPRAEPREAAAESVPEGERRDGREPREGREERGGRRGRRGGRGRGRERGERETPLAMEAIPPADGETPETDVAPAEPQRRAEAAPRAAADGVGVAGERLTRDEAFDLVRRAVIALTRGPDDLTRASDVRGKARELLGRDSESLSDRNFGRILRDAHDANMIDLRRRGDDFEVSRAAEADSVADQLAKAAAARPPQPGAAAAAPARRGMGPRRAAPRGRAGAPVGGPPPELLSIGVVDFGPPATSAAQPEPLPAEEPVPEAAGFGEEPAGATIEAETRSKAKRPARGGPAARGATARKRTPAAVPAVEEPPAEAAPKARRTRARKATPAAE